MNLGSNSLSAGLTQSDDKRLAILGYHKIGPPPPDGWDTWYYIPETMFTDHLSYLRDNGWQVIDVAAFLRGLQEPDTLPVCSALLTFDDGYRSMRTVTLPLLQQFGYPAVLFVPTDFIGGFNLWDVDDEPQEAICTWDDLRELERCGVSIQSHGTAHHAFSELSDKEQQETLKRSKLILEAGLTKNVEIFSFPYGDAGRDATATSKLIQQLGYRAACLYDGGTTRLSDLDPYRLPRLALGPDTNLSMMLERK